MEKLFHQMENVWPTLSLYSPPYPLYQEKVLRKDSCKVFHLGLAQFIYSWGSFLNGHQVWISTYSLKIKERVRGEEKERMGTKLCPITYNLVTGSFCLVPSDSRILMKLNPLFCCMIVFRDTHTSVYACRAWQIVSGYNSSSSSVHVDF